VDVKIEMSQLFFA